MGAGQNRNATFNRFHKGVAYTKEPFIDKGTVQAGLGITEEQLQDL